MINDQLERDQALDIHHSFIIQAPAGSGKTELLIQRYLALLAQNVNYPEEIIAITFTRKAAGEMRERILAALRAIHSNEYTRIKNPVTISLAEKVLQRDHQLNWQLLDNPSRLRIQTIDALCSYLTRQLPITSGLGSAVIITDNAQPLYQAAAQELMGSLENPTPWQQALTQLLLHLDNDKIKVERLFIEMLACRDQWLPLLFSAKHEEAKIILQNALSTSICEHLKKLHQAFPQELIDSFLCAARFAASHVELSDPIYACLSLTDLPDPTEKTLLQWQGLSRLLLTEEGQWRKKFDKRLGLPATEPAKKYKNDLLQILIEFEAHQLLPLWNTISELPVPVYQENQWNILQALIELLPVLVGELHLIFKQQHCVDFSEVALRSLQALGTSEEPTDLALALDYRIQHILVDEFQDTSQLQWELLEQLTAGWQNEDGKTLFLVGDPMQSIYRFRKAEVALFTRAQRYGLNNLHLIPLYLCSNFRSSATLVNWVNQHFVKFFKQNDAIQFFPSQAIHEEKPNDKVQLHAQVDSIESETEKILQIIQTTWTHDPNQSIAILVRSRNHLLSILPALENAQIPYHARDIESLADKSIIQDLSALTIALSHLGHRTAWLALLRAPWCGLPLEDLTIIANEKTATIWLALQKYADLPLSSLAKQQLARIMPVLQRALLHRQRDSLANWVKNTWYSIGGLSCLKPFELDHANRFFSLLELLHQKNPGFGFPTLENDLKQLFAESLPTTNAIEIMTIHKAKGLEFDVVILPSLERRSRREDSRLLLWQEETWQQQRYFLLAPIKSATENHDPIYAYLARQEQAKADEELVRLLYVAATRAKKQLHLLANFKRDKNQDFLKPANSTFLNLLVDSFNLPNQTHTNLENNNDGLSKEFLFRRLLNWQPPSLKENIIKLNELASLEDSSETSIYTPAQASGIVIHRMLYRIATEGLTAWKTKDLNSLLPQWEQSLIQLGLDFANSKSMAQQIKLACELTLKDSRAQWILSRHESARAEWPLTGWMDGKYSRIVIDRTFIDEQGQRWIIDYKTTHYDGQNLTTFLANELLEHQAQLVKYAKILRLLEQRPIKFGLYYPLLGAWHEWSFTEDTTDAHITL